jgi:hypothetical protein
MAVIFQGPDPDQDGVCAWTRADLCRWMQEHLGKSMHLNRTGFVGGSDS